MDFGLVFVDLIVTDDDDDVDAVDAVDGEMKEVKKALSLLLVFSLSLLFMVMLVWMCNVQAHTKEVKRTSRVKNALNINLAKLLLLLVRAFLVLWR